MFLLLFMQRHPFLKDGFTKDGRRIVDEPLFIPNSSNKTRQSLDDEWKNIRIKWTFEYLTGEVRDHYTCYEEGQLIVLNYNKTCEKNELVQNFNYTIFNKTLKNLQNFVENFIQVIPDKNRDSDLEVSIMIPNFPVFSGLVAQAGVSGWNELKRPNSGFMMISASFFRNYFIDTESQFGTNTAFGVNLLFHELMHVLVSLYSENFRPYNSTEKYTKNQTFCSFTKYGKKFKFLTTPYAHIFAKKHYGVEVFEGDDNNCRSGIEIELNGGSGTAGGYVDFRPFYTEAIIGQDVEGKSHSFNRITDVTIALLQDTGNYKCNWSMAQPLVWGNPESQIGGKFIKDFAT